MPSILKSVLAAPFQSTPLPMRKLALAAFAALTMGLAAGYMTAPAQAGELSLSFGFGSDEDGNNPAFDGARSPSNWRDTNQDDGYNENDRYNTVNFDRPRYRHPDFFEPPVRWHRPHRRYVRYDTVCRLIPVRVWDGYDFVIEDVKRCKRVVRRY